MVRLFLALCILIPFAAHAQEWESGPNRVDVVELFTSEGCSSCPPADRWLSTLKNNPKLFSDFIPMAFHVDYWDYIGWEDRFAKPSHTARQRQYVREGSVSQPYTPGIVINSEEWRQWFRGKRSWEDSTEKVGNLRASLTGDQLNAQFEGDGAGQLHVAILGIGLSSQVAAGENHGRELKHDFVVLDVASTSGEGNWELTLPPVSDQGQAETAVAIWVTPSDSQTIIQATGGYLN